MRGLKERSAGVLELLTQTSVLRGQARMLILELSNAVAQHEVPALLFGKLLLVDPFPSTHHDPFDTDNLQTSSTTCTRAPAETSEPETKARLTEGPESDLAQGSHPDPPVNKVQAIETGLQIIRMGRNGWRETGRTPRAVRSF